MTTPLENEENYSECICPSCPSYPGKGEKVLYCSRGKSQFEIKMEGCLCPAGCPVHSKYKLKDMFYCAYGKAK